MSKRLTASVLSALAIAAPTHAEESTGLPITVTATRFKESTKTVLAPVTVVTKDQIQRHSWATLSEALRNQPSLEVRGNGGKGQNTSVYMRGFSPAQSLVLVDGMRLSRGSMGSADISGIPLNQVERIEIIRGARASVYGADAVAGVINIITRSNQGETGHRVAMGLGSDGYGNADWSSRIAATEKDTMKLGAAYSREDGYNIRPSASDPGDEHGYWSKNAQFNNEHLINDEWRLFTSARWMQMQNAYAGSNATTWANEKQFGYTADQSYQAALETSTDNYQSSFVAQYADTDYLSGFNDDQSKDDATYKNYTDQTSLGWYNLVPLSHGFSLGGGVDWRENRLKKDSAFEAQTHNTGEYALVQYEQNAWSWELSGRNDDNSAYGSHQTWRTGAGWAFMPDYRLTANYSTAFRAPSFVDLFYPVPYGNLDLKPEEAKGGEVGIEGQNALFQWKISAYRSLVENMIVAPAPTYFPENIGHARLQGIETEVSFVTGLVRHHVSADFADPKDEETGKQLKERAHQSYKWQAETSWQKWDGAASWMFQGERFADDDNTIELGGYSLWDISAGYHLLPQLRLGGRIDNLFDKEYVTVRGYVPEGRSYYLNFAYQM
ncbi:TonB-dependent receptor domain-containing protein [Tolumonas auensis]|uniref:TonB-dependent receptor domain-containing protein n=1 Tax=Tolumonas auensis TaxID=43948 RepID=UPI002AA80D2C|nr:TonB-dependent receptor [Tolumonas auensis]